MSLQEKLQEIDKLKSQIPILPEKTQQSFNADFHLSL